MLNEVDLNMIIDAIENEKCILLIGPELNNLNGGSSKEKIACDYLQSQGVKLHLYEKDGLFLYTEPPTRLKLAYNLKKSYNSDVIPPIYEKIAKIPFNLFISITPDMFLQKTFNELEFSYNIALYNKSGTPNENALSLYNNSGKPKEIDTPNKEIPLLYYLFGVYDRTDSLILTHDDLFNFILAILHKNELPVILRNIIQDAENLIFLGFRFEPWYVQLLMRLFSEKVKEKYKIGISETINPETKTFCINEFTMTFVEDSIPKFIDQIYEECRKRNKLRIKTINEEKHSLIKLEECLLKGNLEEALSCLRKFIAQDISGDAKSSINELILQCSGRYEDLMRKQIQGVLSNSEYAIERAQIQKSVSEILKEIKNFLGMK